ncbi:metallophosphoesterase family protein [Sporolactobacillus sp. CQH2019]|uniref:metallophosphoesterase family protein n=1 Tax=Sporolactobacillus sp. CQH2019 TaxID=3023512 RepID=UPI00236897D8|nr:metallophosphoesterase family protein [Sporolactobacillus sp. CQH2019]MDD9149072.1 metallophosphoesterase family protein [Sporolactobacillus sp. CQH2019]
MKIAALYDIHGNFPALKAVLNELESIKPDWTVIGGDMVSGPMPVQTLECLLDLQKRTKIKFIRGNGDREVVEAARGRKLEQLSEQGRKTQRWAANELTDKHLEFLANLDSSAVIQMENAGEVLFCHATPESDEQIFTPLSPRKRLETLFARVDQPIVVCGHTHMQFKIELEKTHVINSGSVGMPFANQPGAYWLLIHSNGIEFKQTQYDFERAAGEIRKSNCPTAENFIKNNLLHIPDEKESMVLLEKIPKDKLK